MCSSTNQLLLHKLGGYFKSIIKSNLTAPSKSSPALVQRKGSHTLLRAAPMAFSNISAVTTQMWFLCLVLVNGQRLWPIICDRLPGTILSTTEQMFSLKVAHLLTNMYKIATTKTKGIPVFCFRNSHYLFKGTKTPCFRRKIGLLDIRLKTCEVAADLFSESPAPC